MAHTAIILGAGIGGIATANELRKRCAKDDRVIVVDRVAMHVFAPSLLWLAVGKRQAHQIQRPARELLQPGIEFIQGTVDSIDPAAHAVTVDGKTLHGDALVIALGAELAAEKISGLAQAGHNIYTLDGAESLRGALDAFNGGRVVILTAGPVYKCPAAPYEAALLIEDHLRKRGVRARTTIEMHAAEPAPMGVAGPAVSDAVKSILASRNIAYTPGHQVSSVDPTARTLTFVDGASVPYDVLAFVPPHCAPQALSDSGLSAETGWIPVDRATLETKVASVYAIGDVATIPLSIGKPLPKAGVFAHAQAAVVAKNIADSWKQQPTTATFNGHGACFLEVGAGKAAVGTGNFYGEPKPTVTLKAPSFFWHAAKVIFEKRWLRRWPF